MIEEISKRPFARPLFLLIAGIVLQLTLPDCNFPVLICLFTGVCLCVAFRLAGTLSDNCCYATRWVWGCLFACLMIVLSMHITALSQRQETVAFEPGKIQRFAAKEQQRLVEAFDCLHLTNEEKSVLATVTLGYKQAMSREMKRNFAVAGVAHILAVSGFHVAIVCGFISLALGFLPKYGLGRWLKYTLTMLLLWSFVCVTGMAASAMRAGIMLSFYLTGKVLRRTTDGYNTLAAAAFCMLVYEPFYLFDIGFQLSYLAVFFILYLQPRLKKHIDVKNPLLAIPWEWVTVSIAAQAGTLLLCLYYFGQASSVFLFTNLPLTLIASLLIPASLLWLVLPVCIPGAGWLQQSVETLTRWMVQIVDMFSHIPGATFTFRFDFIHLIMGYAILISFLLCLRKYSVRWLLISLFLLLIMLFGEVIKTYYVG